MGSFPAERADVHEIGLLMTGGGANEGPVEPVGVAGPGGGGR